MNENHFKFSLSVFLLPLLFVLAIWTVYWYEIRFGYNLSEFGGITVAPGINAQAYKVEFDALVSAVGGADGFSWSFAPDVSLGTAYQEFEKGKEISGLDNNTESLVFHAGTKEENGKIVSNGGRVLAVTSFGTTFIEATKKSYQTIENLKFDKMNYRKDIGFDL